MYNLLLVLSKFVLLLMIWCWNFTRIEISLFHLALQYFWDHVVCSMPYRDVNWRHMYMTSVAVFYKSRSALWKFADPDTDDCYNKVRKFQSDSDFFGGDIWYHKIITSYRKFFWSPNSINNDDVISKRSQFASLHRRCLLVKFHDDRNSRTCWTKSPSF